MVDGIYLMPNYAHPHKCGVKENRRHDNLGMTRAEGRALTAAFHARCGALGFREQIARRFKLRLAKQQAASEGAAYE